MGSRKCEEANRYTDSAFEFQDLFLGQHQILCNSIVLSTLCAELCVLMPQAGVQLRHLQGVTHFVATHLLPHCSIGV